MSVCLRIFLTLCATLLHTSLVPAQTSTLPVVSETFSIELSMPTPMVLLNSEANLALCAQWLPADYLDGEQPLGADVVRLVTVDLNARKVVKQTDLPAKVYGFGLGRDEIYVARHDTNEVFALDASTHKKLRSHAHEGSLGQLEVVGNELVCSLDGRLRLNLEDLTKSDRWPGYDSQSLKKNPGLQRFAEVFPAEGAWHVDGVMYGAEMAPVLIVNGRMTREQIVGDWDIGVQHPKHIAQVKCRDLPLIVAISPKNIPADGADMDLVAKFFVKHQVSPIAEYDVGKIESRYFDTRGERVKWKNSELLFRRALDLSLFGRYKPYKGQFYLGDDTDTPLAIASSRSRIAIAANGALHLINLGDNVTQQIEKVPRLKRKQSLFTFSPAENDIVLQHELWGPSAGVTFNVSVPCDHGSDRTMVDTSTGTARISSQQLQEAIQNQVAMLSEDVVQANERRAATYFKQITGAEPEGRCFLQPVNVVATAFAEGQKVTDSMNYSLIVQISKQDFLGYQQNKEQTQQRINAQIQQAQQKVNLEQALVAQENAIRNAEKASLERRAKEWIIIIAACLAAPPFLIAMVVLGKLLLDVRSYTLRSRAAAASAAVNQDSKKLRWGFLAIYWSMGTLLLAGVLPLLASASYVVGLSSQSRLPESILLLIAGCGVVGLMLGTVLSALGSKLHGSWPYVLSAIGMGCVSVLAAGYFAGVYYFQYDSQSLTPTGPSVGMRSIAWVGALSFVAACLLMLLFARSLASSLQQRLLAIRAIVVMSGIILCGLLYAFANGYAWLSSYWATHGEMLRVVNSILVVIACMAFILYILSMGLFRDLANRLGNVGER